MIPLLLLSLLSTPKGLSMEASAGLGGVQWKVANQPKINSSSAVSYGIRYSLTGEWQVGTALTFNAYQGDDQYHVGPGLIMVEAMAYYLIPMDEFTLSVGAGLAFSTFFSLRRLNTAEGVYPAGDYSYISVGALAGLSVAMYRTLPKGLKLGLSLKYFSGIYMDSCFEGPVDDCREVDTILQHWVVGLSLSFDL